MATGDFPGCAVDGQLTSGPGSFGCEAGRGLRRGCAQTALTTRRELTYVPFGLTMIRELADHVAPALKARLAARRELLVPPPLDPVVLGVAPGLAWPPDCSS
jgi:hypothetical protein